MFLHTSMMRVDKNVCQSFKLDLRLFIVNNLKPIRVIQDAVL